LFGSNKTLEFRCHVPTRDPVKAINWLYICSAIIKYTDKICNKGVSLDTQRNLKLHDVLMSAYFKNNKFAYYLSNYVNERKANRKHDDEIGDFTGHTEIQMELKNNKLYSDIT
jgi:hypothetical protein